MELDGRLLAKLTIEAYLDQEFRHLAAPTWTALFNPTELAFTKKNQYNTTPSAGSSQPQTAYGAGEPTELSLDLFFDGTGVVESELSVVERVGQLLEMGGFRQEKHQPYYLHLHWGSYEFYGVLKQADVKYTLFDRSGSPLRATMRIALQEVVAPEPLARMEGRESSDLYQRWLVAEGEQLEAIADEVYGSSAYWRPLAEANRLRNPRALEAGTMLVLPPLAPIPEKAAAS